MGSFATSIRYLMTHGDHRFRTCQAFIDCAYRMVQDQRIRRASEFYFQSVMSETDRAILDSVRSHDLIRASEEESRGVAYSSKVFDILSKHSSYALQAAHITSSSRLWMTSLVMGMSCKFGKPTLVLSITPSVAGNPIVHHLLGRDINLRELPSTDIDFVHQDPYLICHLMRIVTLRSVEHLLGIRSDSVHHLSRTAGVFGMVNGFVGAVDGNSVGTLTINLVLWLSGAPPMSAMGGLLKSEDFKYRVKNFIESTMKEVDTTSDTYLHAHEIFARSQSCQTHRIHPSIQSCLLGDHDVSLILNAPAYSDRFVNVVKYIGRPFPITTLLSSPVTDILGDPSRLNLRTARRDALSVGCRILSAYLMARVQAVRTTPLHTINYLMGWGDGYMSGTYVAFDWDVIIYMLVKSFPQLRRYIHVIFAPRRIMY